VTNLKKLFRLLLARNVRVVAGLARRWFWSDDAGVGLRRELLEPIPARKPRVPLRVRPLQPGEEAVFVDTRRAHGEDVLDRVNAAHLLGSGLRTCYVAVDEQERPVYMQYLVFPDENDRIAKVFGGLIPPLEEEEALLEFAYTLEEHRALGVMPYAVAELAAEARRRGAARLVTFVPARNPTVLRYFRRIGFEPFSRRRERYRLFRRRVDHLENGSAG
jgi:GNAT superfamily N-acetyltransferase